MGNLIFCVVLNIKDIAHNFNLPDHLKIDKALSSKLS